MTFEKKHGVEILNRATKMLVEVANENGISLEAEFGTREKFSEFVVAVVFRGLMDLDVNVKSAVDIIFGDGSYTELVDSVWNKANEK